MRIRDLNLLGMLFKSCCAAAVITFRLDVMIILSTASIICCTSYRSEYPLKNKHKKDLAGELQWLGIAVVRAMITVTINDALVCGTFDWDTIVYRAFCLLILSCGGSRIGDVGRFFGYEGKEYLRFEHIKIRLFDHDGIETLSMFVEYAYDKGHK